MDKINGQSPDIVVFTGDLYDNYASYHPEKKVEKALSDIQAKYGKYAVWGNRDYGGSATGLYPGIIQNGRIWVAANEFVIIRL